MILQEKLFLWAIFILLLDLQLVYILIKLIESCKHLCNDEATHCSVRTVDVSRADFIVNHGDDDFSDEYAEEDLFISRRRAVTTLVASVRVGRGCLLIKTDPYLSASTFQGRRR